MADSLDGTYYMEPISGTAGLQPDFSDPTVCEGSAQLKGHETQKVAFLCEAIPNADDVDALIRLINDAVNADQCWSTVVKYPWMVIGTVPTPRGPVTIKFPVNTGEILDNCGQEVKDKFDQIRSLVH